MGASFSKFKESVQKFFKERTGLEIAYITLAAPVIIAQMVYITLNYKKLPNLVPSKFGFDGKVIKELGKWSLYILPATSAYCLIANFTRLKNYGFNWIQPKNPSTMAVSLGLLAAFLGYTTQSQVRIALGKQTRLNPMIAFSLMGVALGLPLADRTYYAIKERKEKKNAGDDATKKTQEPSATTTTEGGVTGTTQNEESKTQHPPTETTVTTTVTETVQKEENKAVDAPTETTVTTTVTTSTTTVTAEANKEGEEPKKEDEEPKKEGEEANKEGEPENVSN